MIPSKLGPKDVLELFQRLPGSNLIFRTFVVYENLIIWKVPSLGILNVFTIRVLDEAIPDQYLSVDLFFQPLLSKLVKLLSQLIVRLFWLLSVDGSTGALSALFRFTA